MKQGNWASVLGAAILVGLAGCDRSAPDHPLPPTPAEVAARGVDERFEAGAAAYAKYCALCHGAEATGYAADHAPSLVSTTFLASASDEYIARGIREGRPGTAMAPYGKLSGGPLDHDEVAAIIAFLRDNGPARVRLSGRAVIGDVTRGEAVYTASCQRCHGTRT